MMTMPPNEALFSSDLWEPALEKFADAARLTVELFDVNERVIFGPVHPTPLFDLFKAGRYGPSIFLECARRCLAQKEQRPAVVLSEVYGLAVIGTSLVLEGEVIGAAVGGYAFVDFSQLSEVQILARTSGIPFDQLWTVAREQKPTPRRRLTLNGELLQILGDTLLRARWRALQYEETMLKLEEAAIDKERADRELRRREALLHRAEKMAAAGELAATLAHEINNPLSSVINVLYLLQMEPCLNDSAHSLVATADAELTRVSRIVKQSLSYYRQAAAPQDVDLACIVNNSLEIFSKKLQQAGIELRTRIKSGSVLFGFVDELRQVVDNLLLNAVEAMSRHGSLCISVHPSSDWTQPNGGKGVRFTIADTGGGIPRENRGHIFEPFFTTKADKGTGLGLWVVRGIVVKHGGSMHVRSSDATGRSGTAVSIFLCSRAA